MSRATRCIMGYTIHRIRIAGSTQIPLLAHSAWKTNASSLWNMLVLYAATQACGLEVVRQPQMAKFYRDLSATYYARRVRSFPSIFTTPIDGDHYYVRFILTYGFMIMIVRRASIIIVLPQSCPVMRRLSSCVYLSQSKLTRAVGRSVFGFP